MSTKKKFQPPPVEPKPEYTFQTAAKVPEKAAGTPEAPAYRDMTTNVTDLTNSVAKTVQSFGQQGIKVDVEFSYPPARVKISISW